MPSFSVNPHRFDPYKQFKFRVKWDGRFVAGVSRVSPLRRRTHAVGYREGGDPSTLERGRTHDADFEQWANKVWNLGSGLGSEVSLRDFRKDITIELYNEAGQKVMAFNVFRCWPSEYVALGELEANGGAVAFESLTLEHEGWARDYDVAEPEEPAVTEPPA